MADQSKTEQATPRHRQKAREKGQVTRSRELTSALSMAAVAVVLYFAGRNAVPRWTTYFQNVLSSANSDAINPNGPLLFWTSLEAMRWVFPILGSALIVALASGIAQGGFVFAPDALTLKFDRLNPAQKLQQMVSLAALSNILKSLIPFGAIAWIGYATIHGAWGQILESGYSDSRAFASLAASLLLGIFWKSGLVLLAWAGIDYMLLWRKSEGDLKMSRQEIKDEMKESDGNPQSKARIRKLQRHNRRKQMLKAAETATVVITNPTHYAVALRYEPNMAAPIVVAKGMDVLAAKIKQIAKDNDIPIMENKPLAQALYKGAEVGDMIPAALYHAVAEILVVVFKAQAEITARDAQRRAAATRRAGMRVL